MDELNSFVARQHLPHEMRRRLREYFHQTEHLRVATKQRELLCMMSSALQHEVAWQINQQWLQRVYFLKDAPLDFLVQVHALYAAPPFPPPAMPPPRLRLAHRNPACG